VEQLVSGVDLGTGGVRVVVCDAQGAIVAEAAQDLGSVHEGLRFEQDPREWWQAATACLRAVVQQVQGRGSIVAVSVAATSGTIALIDGHGTPLGPALMYSDARSATEAIVLNQWPIDNNNTIRLNSSWGLPKLLWLLRHVPETVAQAAYFVHAGDVLTGYLCGDWGVTDWTQALKTGYDLEAQAWSTVTEHALREDLRRLPRVVAPGTVLGTITKDAARETGLPPTTLVVAGMTDSCAAQIASGAAEPGQWMSVLGTTLVIKGVSHELLHDPLGRVYSHRHPQGYWLPGAASNVGGAALRRWPRAELAALDRAAAQLSPTSLTIYPLVGMGERFPFVRLEAQGFVLGRPDGDAQLYAATLEGVAYVERLGYAVLAELGADITGPLVTSGGGAHSEVWTQIRADVLQMPIRVPQATGADIGAALLAASATLYPDLTAAARAMVRLNDPVFPRSEHVSAYAEGYGRFIAACRDRGYLD